MTNLEVGVIYKFKNPRYNNQGFSEENFNFHSFAIIKLDNSRISEACMFSTSVKRFIMHYELIELSHFEKDIYSGIQASFPSTNKKGEPQYFLMQMLEKVDGEDDIEPVGRLKESGLKLIENYKITPAVKWEVFVQNRDQI